MCTTCGDKVGHGHINRHKKNHKKDQVPVEEEPAALDIEPVVSESEDELEVSHAPEETEDLEADCYRINEVFMKRPGYEKRAMSLEKLNERLVDANICKPFDKDHL